MPDGAVRHNWQRLMHTIAGVPGVHGVEMVVRPLPRFDLIRVIREPRVPDSDPGEVEGDVLMCLRLDIRPR